MLKALVVDDEAPARSELRYLLDETGGVEVVGEASNATEALQLIKAIPYDIVFLDIDMPGLSGVELAEAMTELTVQATFPDGTHNVTLYGPERRGFWSQVSRGSGERGWGESGPRHRVLRLTQAQPADDG